MILLIGPLDFLIESKPRASGDDPDVWGILQKREP